MKVTKKTTEYTIYQKRNNRYAVKGADKRWLNGEEKVKILLAEALITVSTPAEPAAEEPAEEATEETAEKSSEEATEAAAEEASAEAAAEEENKDTAGSGESGED